MARLLKVEGILFGVLVICSLLLVQTAETRYITYDALRRGNSIDPPLERENGAPEMSTVYSTNFQKMDKRKNETSLKD
ncbi:hypothetical protein BUALT_Bualt03G0083000 [Buddleja alternifolia]|uniref:Uncharacterized protein n=1 Tax=Buddleja alternifolia TaxID=168488 RepID=A0AAV6XYU4_9LAMI|nr:hypothetical protein BUALT_Bualt03G0083000 [Buddleja alternifolia]